MNEASARGKNEALSKDLLADSDSRFDSQAYVLRPDVVLEISKIVERKDHYSRTKAAAWLPLNSSEKLLSKERCLLNKGSLPGWIPWKVK